MKQKLRRTIARYLLNYRGWKTDRKIVVIESDDWGSIRMPSKEVYQKCLNAGYRVDQIAYEKYDSLASEDDLELLFDLLTLFEDKKGNHPVITANALVANPDFEKIRESNFEEYYYESIEDTFRRYPKHSNCLQLWRSGMEEGVFFPQSHGREHLNVSMFMEALKRENEDAHFGFENEMSGCIPKGDGRGGNKYVEALRYTDETDKMDKLEIIKEGLKLFEKLFGYKSESFIPPNYIWSRDFNEISAKEGVRYFQGNRKMKEPQNDGSIELIKHYLGEENRFRQRYLIRNGLFEPSLFRMKIDDWVSRSLKDIEIAFRMGKPAIICSHRLNYVGFINEKNRDFNLKLLRELLGEILIKWPEVEFLNSTDLGKLIDNDE